MTPKKQPTVAELAELVAKYSAVDEGDASKLEALNHAFEDAAASDDAAATSQARAALDAHAMQAEVSAAALKSAQRQLATAKQAEAANARAAEFAALKSKLDAIEAAVPELITGVNTSTQKATDIQRMIAEAAVIHRRLHPGGLQDRTTRPTWPHAFFSALVIGRAGTAFGAARGVAEADKAEAYLMSMVDRWRIVDPDGD